MKWPAYQKYKASGVEWLGDVPTHWNIKRLKYFTSTNDDEISELTDPDYEIEYVDIGSVDQVAGIRQTEPMVFENAPSRARRRVRHGDTIVSTVRTYLKAIATIEAPPENLVVSTGFAVVRPKRILPGFLAQSLRSEYFVQSIVSRSVGVSYPAINASELVDIPLLIPSEEEQAAIAAFLDSETHKVDVLIEKKQSLIEKLREKRSALISQTVTKGLLPEVAEEYATKFPGLDAKALAKRKFKPSGVDWLGDVPEGWKIKRLKHVIYRLVSGVSVNSDAIPAEDIEIGVLKTSCVYGNRFDPHENKRVVEIEEERVSCPVTRNSLIISRMNTPELVGNCGFVENDYPNLFLPDRLWKTTFSPSFSGSVKFFWYLSISRMVQSLTAVLATGTSDSMKNLAQSDFLNICFAMPPTDEQFAIVAYLDQETSEIDRMIEKVESALAKLSEYRTALITAAVTGKIDVRGFQP